MANFHLPIRALFEIRSFSRPLTRPDWRTCKKEESDILWDFVSCIEDHTDLDPLEDDPGWTLYGKMWYLNTDAELVAHRQPRCPPPPFEEYDRDYKRFEWRCQWDNYQTDFSRIHRWYQYRSQWING